MSIDLDEPALFSTGASGIAMTGAQLTRLQQSYDALKESICSTLEPQSRVKPYLEAIEFTIEETGLHFDLTGVEALLDQKRTANEPEALIDLLELNRFAMPLLDAVGFDSFHVLHRWIDG